MTPLTDCRHFRTAEPCRPHKRSGVRCTGCAEYDPTAERILVVKLGALGDVLRTTSCLAPLRARYPRAHVTWVTRPDARPLLAGNPTVDRVLTTDGGYLELLLAEEFDLAIGPDADVLSASITRLARARQQVGFVADGRGGVRPIGEAALAWWRMGTDDGLKRGNRRSYGEWLYDICGLSGPVASPVLAVSAAAQIRAAALLDERAGDARRRVCVNTGASARWRDKRWTFAHYQEFARLVHDEDPESALVLVGGPAEAAFNHALLASGAPFVDGGTDGSVEDLGALMAACDWVLTPDSLGYHVACAVGAPAVCLVGPTAPWELDRYDRNLVLHSDLPCIACYRAECPLPRSCMDALKPAAAWAHIRRWQAFHAVAPATASRLDAISVATGPVPPTSAAAPTGCHPARLASPPIRRPRVLPLLPLLPQLPAHGRVAPGAP